MQSYFLRILGQHCGRYMVLQLLQTLSILFENIRNETSICESGSHSRGFILHTFIPDTACACTKSLFLFLLYMYM